MINNKREDDKRLMLIALEDNHWKTDVNEESPYEDIKKAFSEMIEEFESADNNMLSNDKDAGTENLNI